MLAATVLACGEAVDAASHPWHDAIAEVRVDAARSRLEVSMRVDAAHLEAMIATRDRVAFDIEAAVSAAGGPDEERLVASVRAGMQARFLPADGVATGSGPPVDRFDLHWVGAELEGPDCWLHFEWIAPAAAGEDGAARPVQVRATLLIDPAMQQVNTVSVPGHGAARFASGRTDWAAVDVSLTPRTPGPMRVARAGEAGPRVLLVPGPDGSPDAVATLAAALRSDVRVAVAFWPGGDGEAPPPSLCPPGGWADWAAASLRLRIAAEGPGPVHLVFMGGDAERLAARLPDPAELRASLASVFVVPTPSASSAGSTPDRGGVVARYRHDLSSPAAHPLPAPGGVLADAVRLTIEDDVADAVRAAIRDGR